MLGIQLWHHRGLLWDLLFRSRHIFLVTCWSWDRSIICRGNRRMMSDKFPNTGNRILRSPPSDAESARNPPASDLEALVFLLQIQCPRVQSQYLCLHGTAAVHRVWKAECSVLAVAASFVPFAEQPAGGRHTDRRLWPQKDPMANCEWPQSFFFPMALAGSSVTELGSTLARIPLSPVVAQVLPQ